MTYTNDLSVGERRALGFGFGFAFQPIVDLRNRSIFAYEALVRGLDGEPAHTILSRLVPHNRRDFDQATRAKAIALASRLFRDSDTRLSINVDPNSIGSPAESLVSTFAAAQTHGFPIHRLIFEITEHEKIDNLDRLRSIIDHYRRLGFTSAVDDFGAGFSGLSTLVAFVPDLIKLDRELVRDIDTSPQRQAILSGIMMIAKALRVRVVGEGVETADELAYLIGAGVDLVQGYYIARPRFGALPHVDFCALPMAIKMPRPKPVVAASHAIN
ncbi:EAL domain-containing protein [Acuticoccus sp. M5D2P5]|uniref:EAL domain-containing protein n=1 Tax=Acuticoccus kalidii TaxID=2910977 RepID=UPI001F1ADD4A|nr:EAL domain-containing protein [Acuticoccus kalidii]MCF3936512.1 EAL domain-containing protein [Acuticoccus kalidii]